MVHDSLLEWKFKNFIIGGVCKCIHPIRESAVRTRYINTEVVIDLIQNCEDFSSTITACRGDTFSWIEGFQLSLFLKQQTLVIMFHC